MVTKDLLMKILDKNISKAIFYTSIGKETLQCKNNIEIYDDYVKIIDLFDEKYIDLSDIKKVQVTLVPPKTNSIDSFFIQNG